MTTTNPIDWDPRTEGDKLRTLAELSAAMHHGRDAFSQRVSEMGGYYPSKGEGAGTSHLTQPEAATEALRAGQRDVATIEMDDWERELQRAVDAACRAWDRYRRVVQPKGGVEKLAEPGCELCAKVPAHWRPVFGSLVIMTEPTSKKGRPTYRTLLLCQWCFQFTWPSRAGRLPVHDEVVAHAEGRRVRWHGGVEPRLVEVACPDCGDRSRAERRACSTCGHAGKVLKTMACK